MASLTGQTVSSTYDGLLKTEDNDILGANSKKITDGLGNETGLSLNTDGDVEISGDLKVDGAIIDSNGVSGTSGQILSSTGVGTDWVDLSEISGVDGTGTANNVTKWLDADTVTNSIMTDDGSAVNVGGNITLTGTVDGRDVATDGSKLDGIEAGAQVNTVDSVNGNTGTVVLNSDDIAEGATNLYDKTVTLTEGDNVTITGTYPNFTISSNDVVGEVSSVNAGSGISVDSTTGNVTVTNTGDLDTTTTNGNTTTNAITVGGLHVNSTGAVEMPAGTDGERPTAVAGMLRFNTTTNGFEGYDGTEWGAIGGSSGSQINIDNFNGDGSTTVFNLSQSVDNENVTQVYIDGVYQQKDTYSVVGTAITFSEAPPTGTNNVEVASFTVVQIDTVPDDIVTYAKLATEFTTSASVAASTIDFAAAQVFTKTLSANTTFSITNAQIGMVKDLYLTGDFTFSITNGKLIAGTYDGTVTNFIQIVAQSPTSFWYSISQEQA
jgi:hypothetical protein